MLSYLCLINKTCGIPENCTRKKQILCSTVLCVWVIKKKKQKTKKVPSFWILNSGSELYPDSRWNPIISSMWHCVCRKIAFILTHPLCNTSANGAHCHAVRLVTIFYWNVTIYFVVFLFTHSSCPHVQFTVADTSIFSSNVSKAHTVESCDKQGGRQECKQRVYKSLLS